MGQVGNICKMKVRRVSTTIQAIDGHVLDQEGGNEDGEKSID